MTDRDLKKLKRQDLLKLLLDTEEENRRLREELGKAREQLDSRKVVISEAGNLADAAMRLSGIFEDAQNAADIYVKNAEQVCQEQERRVRESAEKQVKRAEEMLAAAEKKCGRMEQECRARCDSMTAEASQRTAEYEESVRRRIRNYVKKHPELRGAFDDYEKDGKEGSAIG